MQEKIKKKTKQKGTAFLKPSQIKMPIKASANYIASLRQLSHHIPGKLGI
ncbi:MAG: hypothetical protein NC936_02905 [Candidatus Omnitrophica bacterium]|nr:hypothetical protein [Candidatus Omnitrophota bacterium]